MAGPLQTRLSFIEFFLVLPVKEFCYLRTNVVELKDRDRRLEKEMEEEIVWLSTVNAWSG